MTPKDEVREIITGILAQAKMKYPEIKLYYDVFLFDAAAYAVAKNKMTHHEKTRRQQEGKRILGVKRVKSQSIFKVNPPPSPPFWTERKRVSPLGLI